MTEATATWIDALRFEGISTSNHAMVVDGEKHTASSPMELVLIGLCACTGYDVVSILRKKREPFAGVQVRARAERASRASHGLYGNPSHLPHWRESFP